MIRLPEDWATMLSAKVQPPPVPDARWVLWCHDMFDRDSLPTKESEGTGIVAGLVELWRKHLSEGTAADGSPTLNTFELRTESGARYNLNHLTEHRAGVALLRAWAANPAKLVLLAREFLSQHHPESPLHASDEIFRMAATVESGERLLEQFTEPVSRRW